ncbi:peptide chain release factor N(5)-glutamine methyltransferase [Candidatus Gracilibacteria bacterium]|nr:peptide chain release factor N(5)-glutamine methyltransferase [Candidatus Gracilibacteria bacterium]
MKDNQTNLILQKITGLSKEQLFLNGEICLTSSQQERYDNYVIRLNSGEPLEYILEQAEFYGEQFFVDKRVLIPRNDTEIMVDRAILEPADIYIDIGTGSGCIPVSVIKNSKNMLKHAYALDISTKALEVANINIKTYDLTHHIELLESNLLEKVLDRKLHDKQIVITANLPYIKQDDFENMDESVYLNEPKLALYGGKNTGFELYETLIGQCQELVECNSKITLFIELGFDQKDVCEEFLTSYKLAYQIFQDNGGVDRCVRVEI